MGKCTIIYAPVPMILLTILCIAYRDLLCAYHKERGKEEPVKQEARVDGE